MQNITKNHFSNHTAIVSMFNRFQPNSISRVRKPYFSTLTLFVFFRKVTSFFFKFVTKVIRKKKNNSIFESQDQNSTVVHSLVIAFWGENNNYLRRYLLVITVKTVFKSIKLFSRLVYPDKTQFYI